MKLKLKMFSLGFIPVYNQHNNNVLLIVSITVVWVSQELGGWFYNGGWEIFKVSLPSWQRDAKPVLYEDPPILSPPPPHTSLSLQTPTPTVLSVVLFLWQNGWSHHIWCAILLNDNMDLHMFSLGTLVPEGSWYVL